MYSFFVFGAGETGNKRRKRRDERRGRTTSGRENRLTRARLQKRKTLEKGAPGASPSAFQLRLQRPPVPPLLSVLLRVSCLCEAVTPAGSSPSSVFRAFTVLRPSFASPLPPLCHLLDVLAPHSRGSRNALVARLFSSPSFQRLSRFRGRAHTTGAVTPTTGRVRAPTMGRNICTSVREVTR